jgi:hypothetical protein
LKAVKQALSAKKVDAALTEGDAEIGKYSDLEQDIAMAGTGAQAPSDIIDPAQIAAGVAPLAGCSGYWCESGGVVYTDGYRKVWAPNNLEVWGADNDGSTAALKVVRAGSWYYMLIDNDEIDSLPGPLWLNKNNEYGVIIYGPDNDILPGGGGHVGALQIVSGSQVMVIDGNEIDTTGNQLYLSHNTPKNVILVDNGGNVGIGTDNPLEMLSVAGTIQAYELILDTGWSDYVFEEDYDLMSLPEVEQYIAENRRLPGMPSSTEVQEHGLPVADSQALLLQKVEELTLHMIEQNKRINELQAQVAQCAQAGL